MFKMFKQNIYLLIQSNHIQDYRIQIIGQQKPLA